ncbi:MAG: NIPSNAP family protein [Saprospiraceae bacterium]|jgi:hypothetical protein
MYIVRDIFQLKFGMFKEAIAAMRKASKHNLLPSQQFTILSDFTGDAYRLVLESNYSSLAEFEHFLTHGMADPKWQEFYSEFKNYIVSSHREIMKRHDVS